MTGRIGLIVLGVVAFGLAASFTMIQRGEFRRAAAFWIGWLFPGLGHFLIGRWKKGLFFAAALSASYVAGLWICGWRVVTFEENPFYYVGQFGSGLTALFGALLDTDRPFRTDVPVSWYDPGLLYVCVAGLLNLVVMLSVFNAPANATESGRVGTTAAPLDEEEVKA